MSDLKSGFGRFASVFLVFVACYAWILHGAGVREITDTALYRTLAAQPLSFVGVFANQRPLLYPLIIRLFGENDRIVVAVQILAYLGSWGALAWIFYRALLDQARPWLATGLAAVTFYVALYPDFAGWNHLIMTESLSLSGLVLMAVLLVRFLQDRRARDLLLLACVAMASSLLRDVNGYFALFLLLPLAVFAWRRMARPGILLLSGAILVFSAAFMNWSADRPFSDRMAARWIFPMLDDIGREILPDPKAVKYFRAHGMPMNDALRGMAGKYAFEGKYDWQFALDPELQAFRTWLVNDGKSVYMRFLISHPRYTLGHVWRDREDLFQAFDYRLDPYPDTRYTPALPATERLSYDTALPPRVPLVVAYAVAIFGSVAMIAAGILQDRRRVLDAGCVLGAFTLMLLPLAIVVEHGDSMETARHAVSIPAQASLAALMVLFLAAKERLFFFEKKKQKTFGP